MPPREDGRARSIYATVAVTQLTRRRTRRTPAVACDGQTVTWGVPFDFSETHEGALVVVDVWDAAGSCPGLPAEILGKVVLNVSDCRRGVPHLYLSHLLLGGELAVRLLFDYETELPSDEF